MYQLTGNVIKKISNYENMSKDSPNEESKKDVKKELREEQQEGMMDLALKTNSFLEKLKAETKKNRVQM